MKIIRFGFGDFVVKETGEMVTEEVYLVQFGEKWLMKVNGKLVSVIEDDIVQRASEGYEDESGKQLVLF